MTDPARRWRLLLTPPFDGADNMALDEALLARARATGEVVMRVYTWSTATLSFGRHQTVAGAFEPDRVRAAGVGVVRRLTGGRAVLHDREITYSVTAPVDAALSLRESYGRINRLLLDGLRRLGVRAEVARVVERTPAPAASPCFERPGTGELVVEGRKLVGSAQWRDGGALLQHGSILVDDDQPRVLALASRVLPSPARAATLREALGGARAPTAAELAETLFAAVVTHEDAGATALVVDDDLRDAMGAARVRYEDDAWTWRR